MLNFFLFQFPSGNNWSKNWTIFSLITTEFLYLQHKSLFHSHINFCLGLIIPFSSDPKWETIVHQGVSNPHSHYLSIPLSILGCTAPGLQAVLCSPYSLTAGRARPALCREIQQVAPLGTDDDATCLSLPLSKNAARGSYINTLSV